MTASAYFLSGRLPASRFLFVYPAVSNMADRPEFRVETLAAELTRSAPRSIVLQRHNRDSFSGWRADVSFAAPPWPRCSRTTGGTEIGDYALTAGTERARRGCPHGPGEDSARLWADRCRFRRRSPSPTYSARLMHLPND
jgi:hypothetical protein